MSVITFPTTLTVSKFHMEQIMNDLEFDSPFGSQSIEIASAQWIASMVGANVNDDSVSAGLWKALLLQLRGKQNQLALWDLGRPAPIGTMRGTMTLNANAAQGATSLQIVAAGQAAKTLLPGDLLGLGTGLTQQVVMVIASATSNGSGIITVTTEGPLRNAFTSGAAVTWDKPCVLYRRSAVSTGWDYSELMVSGFTLDLKEDWRT